MQLLTSTIQALERSFVSSLFSRIVSLWIVYGMEYGDVSDRDLRMNFYTTNVVSGAVDCLLIHYSCCKSCLTASIYISSMCSLTAFSACQAIVYSRSRALNDGQVVCLECAEISGRLAQKSSINRIFCRHTVINSNPYLPSWPQRADRATGRLCYLQTKKTAICDERLFTSRRHGATTSVCSRGAARWAWSLPCDDADWSSRRRDVTRC